MNREISKSNNPDKSSIYDVVVVGAGPGGLGAALMSARCGAKTLVVEQYGLPGGMAAVAEVQPFMSNNCRGLTLDAPVYGEWVEAMQKYLPPSFVEHAKSSGDYSPRAINKEAAALAAEDLLMAAGVDILYHHMLAEVEVSARRIQAIKCCTKGGMVRITGRNFVDCTGDGDLAAMAGCSFEYGDADGACQPMTLCFKLSHVKSDYVPYECGGRWFNPDWKMQLNDLYRAAQEAGKLSCPRENVLIFPFQPGDEGVVHFNTTRIIGYDATKGKSLSEAEIAGRNQLREILQWLREDVPGFAECRLMSMGVQIGVRESRRIKGMAYLTSDDFVNCAKFSDAVARCCYHIDIHSPHGAGTYLQLLPPGEYYEIPYGCVVAHDCDNLTVGGRPISVDVSIHSSMRIMPTAISVGQAAGVGAALASIRGISPGEIAGETVRNKLVSLGANL